MPLAGIEPALLAETDFESVASTNSATGARGRELQPAAACKSSVSAIGGDGRGARPSERDGDVAVDLRLREDAAELDRDAALEETYDLGRQTADDDALAERDLEICRDARA